MCYKTGRVITREFTVHLKCNHALFFKIPTDSLVTQPILQCRPNPTELRSMDYYHQIFCTLRKCKRKVPPPSLLRNEKLKSWVVSLFFLSFCSFKCFFQNLKLFKNYLKISIFEKSTQTSKNLTF